MKKDMVALLVLLIVVLAACGGGGGSSVSGGGGGTGTGMSPGFVVVGDLEMKNSTDGVTWLNRGYTDETLYGIAYGNGTFVAVGGDYVNGYAVYQRSTDGGVTWPRYSLGSYGTLWDVAYGNSRFVAVGNSGSAFYSSDGQSWSAVTVPQTVAFTSISFDGAYFIAVGYITGYVYDAWYSTNGTSWTKIGMSTTGSKIGIGYGNGTNVIVGYTTVSSGVFAPTAWYSTNRTTWTSTPMDTTNVSYGYTPAAVAYGNGRFVAVGGTNTWWSSNNGVTWHYVPVVGIGLKNITYGGGKFVAVGFLGQIMTSADGTQWTNVSPGGHALNGVIYWP